ncbi:MAG: hypothetical protein ABFC84_03200 [Veillonellales bacterium]
MNLLKVKAMAKTLGIKPGKLNKTQIIQAIQVQENNFPCFGTAKNFCDQQECLWRQDCLASLKAPVPSKKKQSSRRVR